MRTNDTQTIMPAVTREVTSDVCVELQLLAAGYCKHPEFLTLRGGAVKPVHFPAGFAVIRHPSAGYILYDTGYSSRFFEETSRFPAILYRWITPVTFDEQDSAVSQLRRLGIGPDEIGLIVLSHFHADHTAGLRDFPHARLLYKREAYETVRHLGAFASVKAGCLPSLLPDDLEQRSFYVEDTARRELPHSFPFEHGYDLLGDGSLIVVDVPGHAAGQIGLFVLTTSGEQFLCADAVWSSRAYRENRTPHAAARLIMDNHIQYDDTFKRLRLLHERYPHIRIIPSHCGEIFEQQREA